MTSPDPRLGETYLQRHSVGEIPTSYGEEEQSDNNGGLVTLNIKKVFGGEYKTAIAIAKAESGLRPIVYHTNSNGSVDCGLFQINSIHKPTKEQCENPEENAKMAYEIYKRGGWNHWVAYKTNSYLKYL